MKRSVLLLLAGGLLCPAVARAQDRPVELGVDGGFEFRLYEQDDDEAHVFLPGGLLRVGFSVSDHVQIEPILGFRYASSKGWSETWFQIFPYVVYNFGRPISRGPYVRMGGGLAFANVDTDFGNGGTTRFAVGAGAGVRFPLADNLSIRTEAAFDHWFENDDFYGTNLIGLLVGLSFFPGSTSPSP